MHNIAERPTGAASTWKVFISNSVFTYHNIYVVVEVINQFIIFLQETYLIASIIASVVMNDL